jgi:hypothetical protein
MRGSASDPDVAVRANLLVPLGRQTDVSQDQVLQVSRSDAESFGHLVDRLGSQQVHSGR